jgi:hypothetical protein
MSMTAALVAFTVISAGSKVLQGVQENKAAKAEAELLEQQGRIEAAEAQAEAQRVADERRKFQKRQILAFLKNGVALSGSPLLVVEETIRKSQEEVNAIATAGRARTMLRFQQAALERARGRNALIGGFLGAGTTLASSFIMARSIGPTTAKAASNTSRITGVTGTPRTNSFILRD